jgi:hypothetical protein
VLAEALAKSQFSGLVELDAQELQEPSAIARAHLANYLVAAYLDTTANERLNFISRRRWAFSLNSGFIEDPSSAIALRTIAERAIRDLSDQKDIVIVLRILGDTLSNSALGLTQDINDAIAKIQALEAFKLAQLKQDEDKKHMQEQSAKEMHEALSLQPKFTPSHDFQKDLAQKLADRAKEVEYPEDEEFESDDDPAVGPEFSSAKSDSVLDTDRQSPVLGP